MVPSSKPSLSAADWNSLNADNHVTQGSALTSGKGIVAGEGQGILLCARLILKYEQPS